MGHRRAGTRAVHACHRGSWAPELHLLGGVAEAPGAYISPFITSMTKAPAATPAFAFAVLFMAAAARKIQTSSWIAS